MTKPQLTRGSVWKPNTQGLFHALPPKKQPSIHDIKPTLNKVLASFLQTSQPQSDPLQGNLSQIVLVDGHYVPACSHVQKDIKINQIDIPFYQDQKDTSYTRPKASSLATDITVSSNLQDPHPVLLLCLTTQPQSIVYPQVHLSLEHKSHLHLIEYHMATVEQSYLSYFKLNINLKPHAQLQHTRLVYESSQGQHKNDTQVYQEASSSYSLHAACLRGAWRHSHTQVCLAALNAQCHLRALDVVHGQQTSSHTPCSYNTKRLTAPVINYTKGCMLELRKGFSMATSL